MQGPIPRPQSPRSLHGPQRTSRFRFHGQVPPPMIPRSMQPARMTSTRLPESGYRAGYDGAKKKKGSKVHMAVDTLGHLLALHVTPAHEQDRAQVGQLAQAVQEATGQSVEGAFVDQRYTGEDAEDDAYEHDIELKMVKLSEAKKGFVLLLKRWVVERSFAWLNRFRRLARD